MYSQEFRNDQLSVNISLNKKIFIHLEEIFLEVNLTNYGKYPAKVPIVLEPQYYWLRIVIKNENGEMLKFTGPDINPKGLNEKLFLFNGYKYSKKFSLIKLFEGLNKTGIYYIKVIYGIPPHPDLLEIDAIESNEVKIMIK